MLTYLIYPDNYWPAPFYYWPLIVTPVTPYDIIEACGAAVWIEDEDLAPTGNTYFRVEDTSLVAGSDSPSYFGVWKPKGHG